MIKNILSIAGSDPSGGAGIQADLKTFGALGAYGMAAITSLTTQNTQGVLGVHAVPAKFVTDQVHAVFEDIRVDAVKVGMIGAPEIAIGLARVFKAYNPPYIVLDPVMVSTSGHTLSSTETVEAIRDHLFPLVTMITPNIPEAMLLLGGNFTGDMRADAKALLALGTQGVYLKGGHGEGDLVTDIYIDAKREVVLDHPRIHTENTHGTGCTLSSALAVFLAQTNGDVEKAAQRAKAYTIDALGRADDLQVGHGKGPVHHFWKR